MRDGNKMKLNIILLIILAIFHGCKSGDKTDPLFTNDKPEVIIIEDPTTDIGLFSVKFAVKTDEDLYFSDSKEMYLWESGNILKSGYREFSVENEIITLDSSGDTISTTSIAEIPTNIKTVGSDSYYCIEYSEEEAYAMGGKYEVYSEFYKNNDIISDWYNNEFECKEIISVGPEIFAVDQNGAYHTIVGSYADVFHADILIMHSLDIPNKTIGFNANTEDYGFNYAMNSNQWFLHDGIYYAENGYTWTETGGLIEESTDLHGWNIYPYPLDVQNPFGEAPVLLKAGISNNKLYWIECNSGFVFEYDPNTDELTQKSRLYISDGMHATGIYFKEVLKPLLIDNILYYSEGGSINSLDIETGSLNIFYANPGEVVKYDWN